MPAPPVVSARSSRFPVLTAVAAAVGLWLFVGLTAWVRVTHPGPDRTAVPPPTARDPNDPAAKAPVTAVMPAPPAAPAKADE